MYVAAHDKNKVHGWSRSTVPRSPGSGILVPYGHGQIFMAAQVWHEMSQTLVPGHSSGQLEPVAFGLPVLQVQDMWAACMVQVGVMQVVPLRSRACSVAVVPLGTVSAALTLHSQRCLHVQQYVEPLLVHTR